MKKTNYIDCTGDAVVGDNVKFEKAVFTGAYPKSKFSHLEVIEGKIIKDIYGEAKQQHTFTIELPDGNTMRIKGRNLYRNGCQRFEWNNEEERKTVADEKHTRGTKARKATHERKNGYNHNSNCMYCGAENGHYAGCAR